jgi:hypothetical protein
MKKVLFLFSLLLLLSSCSYEPILDSACIDGSCDAEFWVDTYVNPGSYQDTQGVWHVKYSGLNYFTLKGNTDPLTQEYIINGVPLMETAYDSNFFFTTPNVQWTYPVYSFLGLFSNNNLNTAIPYGYITQTIPQIQNNGIDITNLVGYQITKHTTFDKPYSSTILQAYSKYNSHPKHHMVFLSSFIGKTADIYIKVMFGERLDQVKTYKIKVIFEN